MKPKTENKIKVAFQEYIEDKKLNSALQELKKYIIFLKI